MDDRKSRWATIKKKKKKEKTHGGETNSSQRVIESEDQFSIAIFHPLKGDNNAPRNIMDFIQKLQSTVLFNSFVVQPRNTKERRYISSLFVKEVRSYTTKL